MIMLISTKAPLINTISIKQVTFVLYLRETCDIEDA